MSKDTSERPYTAMIWLGHEGFWAAITSEE
jgi:hypothetical protein